MRLLRQAFHPANRRGPLHERVQPVLWQAFSTNGGPHDTADDGGGGVRIAPAVNDGGDRGAEVMRMGKAGVERDRNGVADISGNAAGVSFGMCKSLRCLPRPAEAAARRIPCASSPSSPLFSESSLAR